MQGNDKCFVFRVCINTLFIFCSLFVGWLRWVNHSSLYEVDKKITKTFKEPGVSWSHVSKGHNHSTQITSKF